jgi:hypothetical protein
LYRVTHYNPPALFFFDAPQEIVDTWYAGKISWRKLAQFSFLTKHRKTIVDISSFAGLLLAAAAQPQPQRLLFMFARAELPPGGSITEKQHFESHQGGALTAVMCVDKLSDEVPDFAHLAAESVHTGKAWDVVFVTTMAGRNGIAPTSEEASRPLDMMVQSLRNGNISHYLAFNQAGELLHFSG